MLKISSNEADYLLYLKANYPEEQFELGRAIRAGEVVEESPLGGLAYFVYLGKNTMYFTQLNAVTLGYEQTEEWSYKGKNILCIKLTKTGTQFLLDVVFIEEESLYLRQLTCGRFDIFNKFNRKNFSKLLKGQKVALIYKATHYDKFMKQLEETNQEKFPDISLGFQIDKNN